MSDKKPIITVLRSSRDEFLGAYPSGENKTDASRKEQTPASAYDNSGIQVTTTHIDKDKTSTER